MADEETVRTDSRHSNSPATPNISNPGTPRTAEVNQDYRVTPPLQHPQIALVNPSVARATPPLPQQTQQAPHPTLPNISSKTAAPSGVPSPLAHLHHQHQSKYANLLAVIEDMGRDIRPTYSGNRSSTERLKRSIVHARILVRECLMECERSARS